MTVAVIGKYTHHNLRYHLLQLLQKLSGIIGTLLYFTQLLFPYTRQFGRFQQLFVDNLNQFHTRRGSYQVLFLLTDIVALEERLDNGSTRGRTADTVLFQGIAQFVVIHQLAGSFHGAQQGGFGVRTRRLRPLLVQVGQVRAALSHHKGGEHVLFFAAFLLFFLLRLCRGRAEYHTPAGFQYLLARNLKLYLLHLAYYGGRSEQTVRIEHGNETACNQVEYAALHIRQVLGRLAGRNDGMVVRHFRVIEHLLRLRQSSSVQRSSQCLVIAQSLQYAGTFGIDVVTQESGIYTRIGRYFLLVKRLDGFQRLIGGESEFPVALHLQGSQVEQTGRSLFPVLAGDVRYGKRRILYLFQQSLTPLPVCDRFYSPVIFGFGSFGGCPFFLFFRFQHQFLIALAENGGEGGVAIHRLQFPVLLGNEVLYFELSVYDERERRRLHTSDGKYLPVLPVLHGVQAGGVHAQQPVTDGTRKPRLVQRLEIGRIPQFGKPFADGFFRQRGNPQTLHRTTRTGFLHHPTLNQLSLLSGITAVYNHVGMLHEVLDYVELAFVGRVADKLDAETGRNHRQAAQAPRLPVGCVFVRFLKGTEMPERPGHLVSVSLDVPVFLIFRSEYIGYVTRHGRLFGNTNYHSIFFFRQCKDNAKIRLSEPGKEVVLVSDTEMQRHRVLKTALFM